jgi:hypothetical protein
MGMVPRPTQGPAAADMDTPRRNHGSLRPAVPACPFLDAPSSPRRPGPRNCLLPPHPELARSLLQFRRGAIHIFLATASAHAGRRCKRGFAVSICHLSPYIATNHQEQITPGLS